MAVLSRRRFGVITLDQALSGGSNVMVVILAAHVLTPADFGTFGLIFLVFTLVQGAGRSILGEPLLVYPAEAAAERARVIGGAAVISVVPGAVVAAVGAALMSAGVGIGTPLLFLGALSPLMILEDVGRYLSFATRTPWRAVFLDALWILLLVIGGVLLRVAHESGAAGMVLVWGGGGALAGLLVPFVFRTWPTPGLGLLRRTWPFSWRYALSFSVQNGTSVAGASVLTGLIGPAAYGGIRGGLLLSRPFGAFQTSAVAHGITEVSHAMALPEIQQSSAELWRRVWASGALLGVAGVVNLVVLVGLPTSVGRLVLGDSWQHASTLLLPIATQSLFLGLGSAPRIILAGLRWVRLTLRIDLAFGVVTLAAMLAGGVLDGAKGAVWGTALSAFVAMLVLWIACQRVLAKVANGEPAWGLQDAAPAAAPASNPS